MAHVAFEDAITEPDNVDEDSYKDFTEVLRICCQTVWSRCW